MTPEDRRARDARVYAEQTWFAVATGTMNGFLLNGMKSIGDSFWVKLLSFLISFFAAFLVLQRSATVEGLFDEPLHDVPGEAPHQRKWRETCRNAKVMSAHVRFVVYEASGSLFYLLLILGSWFAVLLASPPKCP
jgi:hypothetical protein